MKKIILFVLVFLICVFIALTCSTNSNKKSHDISNTNISRFQWKPAGNNLIKISKIFVKNNISGCGEYYVYEITNNEFAVACTSDGKNWIYYVVYPNLDKLYLANADMKFESPY